MPKVAKIRKNNHYIIILNQYVSYSPSDVYKRQRRGIKSRAGLRAGPVAPPNEITKAATKKPTPMWATASCLLYTSRCV